MPIDGPAPAVINALRHCGFDIRMIPATPERLMSASALRNGMRATARRPATKTKQAGR
jgi:hypothetical protein